MLGYSLLNPLSYILVRKGSWGESGSLGVPMEREFQMYCDNNLLCNVLGHINDLFVVSGIASACNTFVHYCNLLFFLFTLSPHLICVGKVTKRFTLFTNTKPAKNLAQ